MDLKDRVTSFGSLVECSLSCKLMELSSSQMEFSSSQMECGENENNTTLI